MKQTHVVQVGNLSPMNLRSTKMHETALGTADLQIRAGTPVPAAGSVEFSTLQQIGNRRTQTRKVDGLLFPRPPRRLKRLLQQWTELSVPFFTSSPEEKSLDQQPHLCFSIHRLLG